MSMIGKIVLITGASKGIGEATARYLAAEGAKVALLARSAEKIQNVAREIGPAALAIPGDVADYSDIQTAVEQTIAHFGGLDVVVNNAGLLDPIGHLGDIDPMAWGQIIDVNVKGVFNACHASLPFLVKQRSGTIINISSGAAYDAYEGWSHYCASKAAVLQITRSVHLEYASKGIRSIGLSPSTIATDMQVSIKASGMNPVSNLEVSDHNSPTAVAKIIAYLCGPGGMAHRGKDFKLKSPEGQNVLKLN